MLSDNQSFVEMALDRSPDQAFWVDAAGRLIYVNQTACLSLGYPKETLLTMKVYDLCNQLDQQAWQERWELLRKQGRLCFEAQQRRRDGSLLEVEVLASHIVFAGEELSCCHVRDIGRFKEALQEKEHWLQVARRNSEELHLARDAAEAANRSKSDFLASMSHEIRTSMNGVIGMTELLRTTTLDAQQQEFLNLLQGSADGLLFLINDILDLSRIEAGKLSLCMAEVSLGQVLQEVAESQRYMIGLKNLQLRVDLDAALPTRVIGDAHRLKQILLNLLVNAIKFTNGGQITLRGHLLEETARETLVRLSVADTGIGMDEEALRRIFAPFEQADTETAHRFGGSGLGLAICKQLTELFGGEITAESTLGQGSVFHVTLPFKKGGTVAAGPSESREGSPHIEGFAPCRILIAEDHESIQSMLDTLLQHLGHQTVCCSDGKSALEHVQKDAPFDLILMDIRMPIMDGLQALRHIRAWEKKTGRRQPIIAFTAHAMSGDREKFLRAGFDNYLAKPLKMQELNVILQDLLAAGKPPEKMAVATCP